MKDRTLDAVRKDIDAVDKQLVELLSKRTDLAIEIGKLKGKNDRPFFTPERERQVYENLATLNSGPLRNDQLVNVFREIISAARAAERSLRIAYWGPAVTFTNMAAIQVFGASCEFNAQDSIDDVFLAVERGHADYGVVPIENSVAGVVPQTLDMFPQTNVKVCAETYVRVHHHFASLAPDLASIERVYAGPQPSTQCKIWLRSNVPSAEIIETIPTTRAAEKAIKDEFGAAIVNRMGASLYGLPILSEHIEDNPQNKTRFLVIGFNEPARTGRDKTSIMFSLRNRPGELYRALGALEKEGVNLMMIESRPGQRASFEYMFFCDCSGHRLDANVMSSFEALRACTLEATIVGSYPMVEGPP